MSEKMLGKLLCLLGLHKFPKDNDFDWVVCERHCLTEYNQKTGVIKNF